MSKNPRVGLKQLILSINRARSINLIIQLLELATRKELIQWRMNYETWDENFDYDNCRIYASVSGYYGTSIPIYFRIKTLSSDKRQRKIEISFNKPFKKRVVTISSSSRVAMMLAMQFFKNELPVLWVRAASFPDSIGIDSNELRGGNYGGIRSDYLNRSEGIEDS